jgi:hypothetical protein
MRLGGRAARSRAGALGGLLLAGGLALAAGVAGCGLPDPSGGSGSGTAGTLRGAGPVGIGGVAPLLTGTAGDATGATSGGSPSTAGGAGGAGGSGVALPTAGATRTVGADGLFAFTTPSHNIGCVIGPTMVRCDIRTHGWPMPPRPADCELDYGQGVALGTGRAAYVCAGDTTLDPNATVLPYDEAVRAGDLACVSTQAYLACRNLATGHGFSLSKETPPPLY